MKVGDWVTGKEVELVFGQWYDDDVSPNLTIGQKEKILRKISDYSLEHNITEVGVKIPLETFTELMPFAHTKSFSGRQIYVVMRKIFSELHPDVRIE
jgi:hypothetical protein